MIEEAIAHLKRVDPKLGDVIDRVGKRPPGPRTEGTHLGAIARAIVFQQLSGKAAGTIHGRFEQLFGGRAPTAEELLGTSDEKLRSVGLSRGKALYLKDLAARAASGALPVDRLHELPDEELLETLTAVKGIGRWTAQMVLLFRLGRLNVWPDLDLGVRKAIQRVYNLRRLPTPEQVQSRGSAWSPFASVAAWYLWRSLELPDQPGSRTPRNSPRRHPPRVKRRTAKRTAAKRPRAKRAPAKRLANRAPQGKGPRTKRSRTAHPSASEPGGRRRQPPPRR
jgi:DNA-3-methyladenine glycosylase II